MNLPQLMTVQQVAEYLGYHPDTVTRKAKAGELPSFQIGGKGRRYFRVADLDLVCAPPSSSREDSPAGSLSSSRGSSHTEAAVR